MFTDKFFIKRHHFLVDREDIIKVLDIFTQYRLSYSDLADLKMGNCGWAASPNTWFIYISVTDKMWFRLLQEFKNNDITLLPENIGYKKETTKKKGS